MLMWGLNMLLLNRLVLRGLGSDLTLKGIDLLLEVLILLEGGLHLLVIGLYC